MSRYRLIFSSTCTLDLGIESSWFTLLASFVFNISMISSFMHVNEKAYILENEWNWLIYACLCAFNSELHIEFLIWCFEHDVAWRWCFLLEYIHLCDCMNVRLFKLSFYLSWWYLESLSMWIGNLTFTKM